MKAPVRMGFCYDMREFLSVSPTQPSEIITDTPEQKCAAVVAGMQPSPFHFNHCIRHFLCAILKTDLNSLGWSKSKFFVRRQHCHYIVVVFIIRFSFLARICFEILSFVSNALLTTIIVTADCTHTFHCDSPLLFILHVQRAHIALFPAYAEHRNKYKYPTITFHFSSKRADMDREICFFCI